MWPWKLKIYSSVAKVLKLKLKLFWELILKFGEVTGEKHFPSYLPEINLVNANNNIKINKHIRKDNDSVQKGIFLGISVLCLVSASQYMTTKTILYPSGKI